VRSVPASSAASRHPKTLQARSARRAHARLVRRFTLTVLCAIGGALHCRYIVSPTTWSPCLRSIQSACPFTGASPFSCRSRSLWPRLSTGRCPIYTGKDVSVMLAQRVPPASPALRRAFEPWVPVALWWTLHVVRYLLEPVTLYAKVPAGKRQGLGLHCTVMPVTEGPVSAGGRWFARASFVLVVGEVQHAYRASGLGPDCLCRARTRSGLSSYKNIARIHKVVSVFQR
jgi:hypothetical protein